MYAHPAETARQVLRSNAERLGLEVQVMLLHRHGHHQAQTLSCKIVSMRNY